MRELKQRASELLRRVAAGETIGVTDRRRPVALISLMPEAGLPERLRAAGEVILAAADLNDLSPPLAPQPGREHKGREAQPAIDANPVRRLDRAAGRRPPLEGTRTLSATGPPSPPWGL